MLKVLMEFRKGVLFVRLYGILNKDTVDTFEKEVKEVIIKSGIKYVVLNISNLREIKESGIKEIKSLRKILKKTSGEFFLFGGEIKELKTLVNLENDTAKEVRKILNEEKKKDKIIIVASHIKEDIDTLADVVYNIDNGIVEKIKG